MPFKLRRKTREWFAHVEREFDLDFDMYYLCLMAGLATGRTTSLQSEHSETTELVDTFPGVYKKRGRLIVALFLSRELTRMGVAKTERSALNKAIAGLVDADIAHLSDAGLKEMNRYSYGGLEVLTEWFDDRPRSLATFLPLYKLRLDDALAGTS